MTKIVNILEIDSKLRKHYEEESQKIPEYVETMDNIKLLLTKYPQLRPRVVADMMRDYNLLKRKILAVQDFEFYYFETKAMIAEFENIIKTPVANSFFSSEKDNGFEDRKKSLVNLYFQKVLFYVPDGFELNYVSKTKNNTKNCDSKYSVVDESTSTCVCCFKESSKIVNNSSFVDNNRVNISSKYTYDRKIHFRDCINQYQGKQNTHIPSDVFKNLEKALINHRVIPAKRTLDRFAKVSVSHIHMFLKSLNYTKYYDDAILIHSVITGVQPDNIEHLEEDLMKDFDAMLTEYDTHFKTADRKNFINTQYVLYQLLRRHKHNCNKDHFVVMRTMSDRKTYHDRICKTIFAKFGWEFAS